MRETPADPSGLPVSLLASHVIPVVVVAEEDHIETIGEALVRGRLPVAEVTFRTAAAPRAIRELAQRGDLLVGAGTVTSVEQVDAATEAGAQFIVSPGTSAAVVRHCAEVGLPVVPGAVTATEVMTLLDLGVRTAKFFPAGTSGGPAAIKALAAPFGQMQFIPTGGVSTSNLREYLSMSCVPAVGGSWMLPADLVSTGQIDAIAALCREAVDAASRAAGSPRFLPN